MAIQSTDRIYSNFLKGLHTDRSEFLSIADTTISETNFNIDPDGVRSRRKGLTTIASSNWITAPSELGTIGEDDLTYCQSHVWDETILVIAYNDVIRFGKLGTDGTVSTVLNYVLDLQTLIYNPISIESNRDYLLISSVGSKTYLVTKDDAGNVLTFRTLVPFIRDYDGDSRDRLSNTTPADPLVDSHRYNLVNQGWTNSAIQEFYTYASEYPRNSHHYNAGIITDPTTGREDFDAQAAANISYTGLEPPRGKIIYPVDIKDTETYQKLTTVDTNSIIGSVTVLSASQIQVTTTAPHGLVSTPVNSYPLVESVCFDGSVTGVPACYDADGYTLSISSTTVFTLDSPGAASIYPVGESGIIRFRVGARFSIAPDQSIIDVEDETKYIDYNHSDQLYSATSTVWNDRIWYGNSARSNRIYFSQILKEDLSNAVNCYSANSPTHYEESDVLATDGGYVAIHGVGTILKMIPFGNNLILFSTEGIWYVTGAEGTGFRADDYTVSKISNTMVISRTSVIEALGKIYFIGKDKAIYTLELTGAFNAPSISNISIKRVSEELSKLTTYLDIQAVYHPQEFKIYWYYNNQSYNPHDPASVDLTPNSGVSDAIIYDLGLDAFTTYTLEGVNFIYWTAPYITHRNGTYYHNVLVDNRSVRGTVRCCQYLDDDFLDYLSFETEASMITSFDMASDPMRTAQIGPLFSYMSKTETEWIDNGSGGIVTDNPSSCKLQARWEWADSDASGKWTDEVELYRHVRAIIPTAIGDSFDNGHSVITTKHNIRGSGRSVNFRLRSDGTNDCKIQGLALEYTIQVTP